MKIALVAPTEIPARRANTVQVMKMAQALVELGHGVRLAAPQVTGAKRVDGALLQTHEVDWEFLAAQYGLRVRFPVDWLPVNPTWRRYDYGYRAVQWARGWGAEVLYTRLPQAAAFASQLKLATILESHDLPQGMWGPWLFRSFLTGKGARRLVVITQALLDDLGQIYRIPSTKIEDGFTVVAPDGVDLERYLDLPAPARARQLLFEREACGTNSDGACSVLKAGWPTQDKQAFVARLAVGYTGHLYAGRGIEMILQMAEALPEVNFMLVGGESADVQRVRTMIQHRKLTNSACLGFIANADLPLYQAACDVLLMPYQKQVAASSGGDIARYLSPMKLFEYLACGRAILCSDLPVLREVLSEQNAMLLPPAEISAWVKAIQTLQLQPELRAGLAEQARQDAGRYTWRARARRVMSGLSIQGKQLQDE